MNELSFKSKTHIMKSMVKDLHSQGEKLNNGLSIHDAIDEIFRECNRSEQIRNQKIHSFWIPEFKSAPNLVMRMKESSKKGKGSRLSVESVEVGSLDEEINVIENCQKKLSEFTMKMSCDYQRLHGIHGLSDIISHDEVSKFLQQNFMNKDFSKGS
ncbi:hypothetical protein DYI26_07610 [Halomonas litopenaei]|nr:hypothetical protein [Halomonas litopenaei]